MSGAGVDGLRDFVRAALRRSTAEETCDASSAAEGRAVEPSRRHGLLQAERARQGGGAAAARPTGLSSETRKCCCPPAADG